MNDVAEFKHFLAHALELEEDAMTRFQELAETMRAHNNLDVAEFFEDVAEEASKHLQEVRSDAETSQLPALAAWEYDWPAEPPESASYESVHYRMDLRQALELALASERAARAFYAKVADAAKDAKTARLAASRRLISCFLLSRRVSQVKPGTLLSQPNSRASSKAWLNSEAYTYSFLGTQPTFTQVPPM